MRRTVPPSAEIQGSVDELLARGMVDDPQELLSELARLGVIIDGSLSFQAAEEQLNASRDIVIAPPDTPREFINNGPGAAHLVCIHADPTVVTEWLE